MEVLWTFLREYIERLYFFRIIEPDQAGVRTVFGKLPKLLGPGGHLVWPIVGNIHIEEISEVPILCEPISATTRDGQTVLAAISLTVSIIDLYKASFNCRNGEEDVAVEAMGIVESWITARDFDGCMDGEKMAEDVISELRKIATRQWGVKILRVRRTTFCKHRPIRLVQD